MAFIRKTWLNRIVENAGRRRMTPTEDSQTFDVERAEGEVVIPGDRINAQNMNNLERRVADGFEQAQMATGDISRDVKLEITRVETETGRKFENLADIAHSGKWEDIKENPVPTGSADVQGKVLAWDEATKSYFFANGGSAEFNFAYGLSAPADTSKLWVVTGQEPDEVILRPDPAVYYPEGVWTQPGDSAISPEGSSCRIGDWLYIHGYLGNAKYFHKKYNVKTGAWADWAVWTKAAYYTRICRFGQNYILAMFGDDEWYEHATGMNRFRRCRWYGLYDISKDEWVKEDYYGTPDVTLPTSAQPSACSHIHSPDGQTVWMLGMSSAANVSHFVPRWSADLEEGEGWIAPMPIMTAWTASSRGSMSGEFFYEGRIYYFTVTGALRSISIETGTPLAVSAGTFAPTSATSIVEAKGWLYCAGEGYFERINPAIPSQRQRLHVVTTHEARPYLAHIPSTNPTDGGRILRLGRYNPTGEAANYNRHIFQIGAELQRGHLIVRVDPFAGRPSLKILPGVLEYPISGAIIGNNYGKAQVVDVRYFLNNQWISAFM